MAIDILSIPLISDKLERVFSKIRRTINWDRGQIKLGTMERKEYLKY